MCDHTLEEMPHKGYIEVFNLHVSDLVGCAVLEKRTPAYIQRDLGAGLIHGDACMAVTDDPLFLSQCLGNGLAEDDSQVLYSVVGVNLYVSPGGDGKVQEAVPGRKLEHVVQERERSI